MKISYLIQGMILLVFLTSCSYDNKKSKTSIKDTVNHTLKHSDSINVHKNTQNTISSESIEIVKNDDIKETSINEIIPYENPKTLNELYSTTFVLDTMYRKTIANGIGNDDDDTYEMIFNRIVGIDTNHQIKWGHITAMDSTTYFDPIYRTENFYYLPFVIDEDYSIVLLWEKTNNGFSLVQNYYNLFINKYGKMKVSDVLSINNIKYLLIELYQPDESGTHSTQINILKDVGSKSLQIIDAFYFEPDSRGNFEECCYMQLINRNEILVKSIVDTMKFEKLIRIE